MNSCTIILLAFSTFLLAECGTKPGVQMRLTKKGMQYVIDVGRKILQSELLKQTFDESGKSGSVEYRLTRMRLSEAYFPTMQLKPVKNVGIQGVFSGITLKGGGNAWYKFKKGWFKFSDNIDLSISISNIYIKLTINIGASSEGHPEIALQDCNSDIGSVDLKFHGGVKAWIYNMFRGLIEKKIKNSLRGMLCKLVEKEINGRARAELETFPVVKKLDKWAVIDYRLTSAPIFTGDYMDVFFKGEFKPLRHPTESKLIAPSLKISNDHDKMIYFWVTNYTLNTAGEVYQGSNQFDIKFEAWDKKVPDAIKKLLNTKLFVYAIPNLNKYPNLPMSVRLVSYKSSKVVMNEGSVHLFLYADATFGVKEKSGRVVEVFTIRFDIDTSLNVDVIEDKVKGKITEFNYNAKIMKSNIGKINVQLLDSPFIKMFIENAIISRANPQLQRGFPLPNLDKVMFQNLDIKLHKSVMRIGTDFVYKD